MEPIFLGLDEILAIHADQIKRYGGASGVRDMRLLEGAVAAARSGTREGYLHPDLIEMAAAYLFHIVRDHPFVDGNKRVGLSAGLVFLDMNGLRVRAKDGELYNLVIRVASGRMPRAGVSDFLRAHLEP